MTKKALLLLDYIKSYIAENKYSPSYDEMKNFMNLKSKSSIFQYIEYLISHNYLFKDSLKARSIKLKSKETTINFYNEISAGKPIETESDAISKVDANDLLQLDKNPANVFACKINGNSMHSYGIYHGDTVLLEKPTFINEKNIYAIQIDNSDITLKKLKINTETIDILGDELNYQKTTYNKDRVNILGKMIKLIRNYK